MASLPASDLVTLSITSNIDQGPNAGFEFDDLNPGATHENQESNLYIGFGCHEIAWRKMGDAHFLRADDGLDIR